MDIRVTHQAVFVLMIGHMPGAPVGLIIQAVLVKHAISTQVTLVLFECEPVVIHTEC